MWYAEDITEAMAEGLRFAERALREEQAVHGLDALDEVQMHPLLAAGLAGAGLTVFREMPYPAPAEGIPKASERERCDLVLAPGGTVGLRDEVAARRERQAAEGTLFAGPLARVEAPQELGKIEPQEAYWLEVKTFGQFSYTDGVAGQNRTYLSQFNACLADVRKLSRVPEIERAGAAIVLFAESPEIAEHDLAAFAHQCLDKDLPLAGLHVQRVEIADRIGNRFAVVGTLDLRPSVRT
ncbi:MAG: hypothetical protein IPJ41_13710 [Phycisphaerales bacterium]|nr:hypothetical protein [Phycisphaerales bacterium]